MSKVKLKAILEDLRKTKENYSEVNEGIAKIRVNLDTIELKTAEEVDNFDKAINLFEALPEEQVSKPSSVLDSLLSSGSYEAVQQLSKPHKNCLCPYKKRFFLYPAL